MIKDDPGATVQPATDVDPVIEVYKQHVDRTLIRENLKRTPEERFLQLMKLQEFAETLQAAGRRARAR